MVPQTKVKFTASRKNELKKTACNPKEKTLNFKEFYELAEGMATEKGPVILYLSKKESLLNGVTYKVGARVRKPIKATKTAKADAAKASESKLVTWMENTMKPMLDEIELYSTQVQRALIDVTNRMATQQVMLDDEFLASLKVLAEAPPAAPERKCPAPPIALQVVQDELTASLDRICEDMRSHGEKTRQLFDSQGKLEGELVIVERQAGTTLCLDEATEAGVCQQGRGLMMGGKQKQLVLGGTQLASLEEAKAVPQLTHWRDLAKRFESRIVPVTIDRRVVLKEQASAVNKALAHLFKAMIEGGYSQIWTDRAFNVRTDAVSPPELFCSATIRKTPDGTPILTVETGEAYQSEGWKHAWGSALMSKHESDGSYTVSSFRLNRKNLNEDSDFLEIVNLDAAMENMKGVLSLARSFAGDVDRLKAASI